VEIWVWLILVLLVLSVIAGQVARSNKRAEQQDAEEKTQQLRELSVSKICPSCAEQIRADASVCKQCSSDVSSVTTRDDTDHFLRVRRAREELQRQEEREVRQEVTRRVAFGLVLAIPIATLAVVFWPEDGFQQQGPAGENASGLKGTEYPTAVTARFIANCKDDAAAKFPGPERKFQEACECTLEEIQVDYSLEKFEQTEAEFLRTRSIPTYFSRHWSRCEYLVE